MLWLLLLTLLSFVWGSLGENEDLDHLGTLFCGLRSFHLTVPLLSHYGKNPGLIAWDDKGMLHTLQNNSICGTWITYSSLESIHLEASYSGCYVTKWDNYYIMPIGVSSLDADGNKTVHKVKVLKCSLTLAAMDVPGLDLCDVKIEDKMSYAIPSIPKGDCENLACCYNSEDEIKPCYYGNTVTAQCTPDGLLSVAISQNMTKPSLLLDTVHLVSGLDAKCDPVEQTNAFVLFQFPHSACGTIMQVRGQIYDKTRCPYTGDNNYWIKMISIPRTSTPPFPSHYKRFIIRTFAFVDSAFKKALVGPVYLHCSASVCLPSEADSCTVTCPVGTRKRRSFETSWNETSNVSSKGPIFFLQAIESSSPSGSVLDIRAIWPTISATLIVVVLLLTFLALRRLKIF